MSETTEGIRMSDVSHGWHIPTSVDICNSGKCFKVKKENASFYPTKTTPFLRLKILL